MQARPTPMFCHDETSYFMHRQRAFIPAHLWVGILLAEQWGDKTGFINFERTDIIAHTSND
jgi:hypothetical protein